MTATVASDFVPVAKTNALKNGEMMSVTIGQSEILIARVEGKFYAADNICPHMGAPLARGKLEGTIVTCPRHASKFNLADGRVVRWTDWTGIKASVSKLFRAPRGLTVYPVKVENDNILVRI
ncbi:MAG: Rieske (2Fe-2S) protein [Chloroflexi bacterium]|nr:Rieske (2Fe-2S) protein [Chloroflexota bacterium]